MKLSISLPDELVARLDAAKDDLVPRSAWIARVVEQALEAKLGASPSAPAEPPAIPARTIPEGSLAAILTPGMGGAGADDSLARPARSPAPYARTSQAVSKIEPSPPERSPRQHSPTCKCPVCR